MKIKAGQIDRDKLEYRKSTCAVITDDLGRILVVQKQAYKDDEWDIPGGGIEMGESREEALTRELGEELGCDKFEIIKKSKRTDQYEWPKETILRRLREKGITYRGQKRTTFLVKFSGAEKDIRQQRKELRKIKWVFAGELEKYLIFPGQLAKMKTLLQEFGLTA